MRFVRPVVFPLAALATAGFIAACGGSNAPTSPPPAQPTATAARMASQSPAPPAAQVEPTATPDPVSRLVNLEPIPPDEPLGGVEAVLGTAPDRRAAQALRDALAADGFEVPGLELFVFALPDDGGNLLVINVHLPLEAEPSPDGSDALSDIFNLDSDQLMRSLATSAAFAEASISRVVLNLSLVTTDGALVITGTLPADVFVAEATGAISQEQANAQSVSEMRWVDAP